MLLMGVGVSCGVRGVSAQFNSPGHKTKIITILFFKLGSSSAFYLWNIFTFLRKQTRPWKILVWALLWANWIRTSLDPQLLTPQANGYGPVSYHWIRAVKFGLGQIMALFTAGPNIGYEWPLILSLIEDIYCQLIGLGLGNWVSFNRNKKTNSFI